MATDYTALYAQKSTPAEIAKGAKRIRELLDLYGAWIDKYRGGVPREWAAAAMMTESNGQFGAAGDASLGEIGYYQIAAYFPPTIGMAAESRMDPETNVMLGMTEYQLDAVKWAATFEDYVTLGSADSYKLARLSFAVGWGGSTGLARNAIAAGYANRLGSGGLYDAIKAYVTATGGTPLGSQSASQVWYRVLIIDVLWQTAEQASPFGMSPGMPTLPPDPPAGPYAIPAPYAMAFQKPTSPVVVAGLVLGALLLWRFSS